MIMMCLIAGPNLHNGNSSLEIPHFKSKHKNISAIFIFFTAMPLATAYKNYYYTIFCIIDFSFDLPYFSISLKISPYII